MNADPGRLETDRPQPRLPERPFVTSGPSYAFYRELFLKVASRMPLGCLRLLLPGGREIVLGGERTARPAVLRVLDPVFFKKCVLYGDVGFGESFVDGDWDSDDPSEVVSWFILNRDEWPVISGSRRRTVLLNALGLLNRFTHWLRPNSLSGSRKNIQAHYDLGNDLYSIFLDPSMTYSCAYFQSPELSLEEAQTVKYDVLCRKLKLRPSDHVLEIGGGWGGFSAHAAERYGCRVTAVTISREQYAYAVERIRRRGLEDRVDIRLMDYRRIRGQFDKIVSIEMIEAVGDRYLETYFAQCHALLKKNGLLALQMITCPDAHYDALKKNVDWIQKHIFPGSLLVSIGRVNQALNRTGDLGLRDLEDMGPSYVRTLSLWKERFNAGLDRVRALGFDESFIRKWNYYLDYCKAGFRMRHISVVQAVYSRPDNPDL